MKRICINNRDELVMLYVDHIAYILADGNLEPLIGVVNNAIQAILSFDVPF